MFWLTCVSELATPWLIVSHLGTQQFDLDDVTSTAHQRLHHASGCNTLKLPELPETIEETIV